MHLAILMTNTDESGFADAHPRDGEKFTQLIQQVRPNWRMTVFNVKDGAFPDDMSAFDGAMITGSPASVNSGAAWTERLFGLIRQMVADKTPVFGACFGHQAIARALGGEVGDNPGGMIHGLTKNTVLVRPAWATDLPDTLRLYGSHKEQVTRLPDTAIALTRSAHSPVTGFAIGTHVYTTQHHPEMSAHFIAALTAEMADYLGPDLTEMASHSLKEPADGKLFAESVARFFEQAHA